MVHSQIAFTKRSTGRPNICIDMPSYLKPCVLMHRQIALYAVAYQYTFAVWDQYSVDHLKVFPLSSALENNQGPPTLTTPISCYARCQPLNTTKHTGTTVFVISGLHCSCKIANFHWILMLPQSQFVLHCCVLLWLPMSGISDSQSTGKELRFRAYFSIWVFFFMYLGELPWVDYESVRLSPNKTNCNSKSYQLVFVICTHLG